MDVDRVKEEVYRKAKEDYEQMRFDVSFTFEELNLIEEKILFVNEIDFEKVEELVDLLIGWRNLQLNL